MSPGDARTITTSVEDMIKALECSITTTRYPPDAPPIVLGDTIQSGQRGRPRVDIKPEDLASLANGRTTMNEIAALYQCRARTIRRRMLEFGLSEPGPPVYVEQEQGNGSIERVYSRGSCANLSQATDEELDAILISIYEQFPSFGRRMIDGYLMALGERVSRQCIEQSYLRVIGPPVNEFGNRPIQRRVYSVPGPNALWHHGGQHGRLICIFLILSLFKSPKFKVSFDGKSSSMHLLMVFHDSFSASGQALIIMQQLFSTYSRISQQSLVFQVEFGVTMVLKTCLLLRLWKSFEE